MWIEKYKFTDIIDSKIGCTTLHSTARPLSVKMHSTMTLSAKFVKQSVGSRLNAATSVAASFSVLSACIYGTCKAISVQTASQILEQEFWGVFSGRFLKIPNWGAQTSHANRNFRITTWGITCESVFQLRSSVRTAKAKLKFWPKRTCQHTSGRTALLP